LSAVMVDLETFEVAVVKPWATLEEPSCSLELLGPASGSRLMVLKAPKAVLVLAFLLLQ
jgi:hypothetical protein